MLVTNLRDFVLVGEDGAGQPAKLETFRLADSADDFWRELEKPRAFAHRPGAGLGEYLARALSHRAALAEPKDLAWLLASYARDGLARVEAAGDAAALAMVRTALEEALGVRFEGERGTRFFHSTLVQTLFYGIFSAWVLWARQGQSATERFDWRTAVWHLRAPVLAAENVYVLDPCCGTGAYMAEVLRRIAANLHGQGLGALAGARVKQAATERVFGFEIMPAPFVVTHLQVGLTMHDLDAPLAEDGTERAGVFLTNALTGWEPRPSKPLPFPELEDERDRAEQVKRDAPILVILGNPPYNGFAGMAVDEERELSEAYRATQRVRRPEGQGLNDLYVRFFRMAERRIAEKTGQGVVCFISNYSWLDGLSFTGMRERYLEAFDAVRIDNLHGDRIISEYAPDGQTSETVFALRGQSPGIKVGTSITLLSRRGAAIEPSAGSSIQYRDFDQAKAEDRRRAMLDSLDNPDIDADYTQLQPDVRLGLPFKSVAVSQEWFDWPSLPELFPVSFPGVKTSRDGFLVDIDLDRLRTRMDDYFDASLSHEEIARRYPATMKTTARFNARAVRDELLKRGGPDESGFIRYAYRPFDNRWLYWEKDTKLLDEKRSDYRPHVFTKNIWLSAAQHLRKSAEEPQACFSTHMSSLHLIERTALMFPAWLRDHGIGGEGPNSRRPNLSPVAQQYLDSLGLATEDLFHHILAVLHDPAYREASAGALRMEWPRIPLPGYPNGGNENAAEALSQSAANGRELAALLAPDTPVPGVTQAPLRPELAAIAVPATANARQMAEADFAITVGWGRHGQGDAVMPGQGHAVERPFTAQERTSLSDSLPQLGKTTYDIHLNTNAFWRNVPTAVWHYKLGGYQVLKKWLSYREHAILQRPSRPEEVQQFAEIARRIAAILLATAYESSSH